MRQSLEILVITDMDPGCDPTVLTDALKKLVKELLGTPHKRTDVEYEPGEPV